jgi:hypothetical protein
MTGNPPTATVTFANGDVNTGGTQACFHVLVVTSATAQPGTNIGIGIESTGDVTNTISGGGSYSFGTTSAPPAEARLSTVSGTVSRWDGATSTVWALTTNWSPATIPSTTVDCQIGSGVRIPVLAANQSCRNSTLQTGGTLNFNNAAWALQTVGSLTIQSGFTFQNAASGILSMTGTTSQSILGGTTFPGGLTIANTGNANVNVDQDTTISGNVAVNQGNLQITSGYTLTVGGNITVASGATLTIQPGATLKMSDGKSLTVNAGGTLVLVGNGSQTALVTAASGSTTGYSVTVN